jgi:hypothetical protein
LRGFERIRGAGMTRGMTKGRTRDQIELILPLLFIFAVSSNACANQVSLGFDDGQAEDGVWIDDMRGHAVVFTAPCDNWTLSKVAIYGGLTPDPKSEMFTVEVWDSNLSLLSKTTDRARSFFSDNLTWAEVDIPDVRVSNSFIVSFYEFAGVFWESIQVSLMAGRS